MSVSLEELKKVLNEIATESQLLIQKYFKTSFDVELKDDQTPVTIVDRLVEDAIWTIIRRHFPDHGIIGEEHGHINPESEYQWVVDPIDGTKSFILGGVDFGTVVGILHQGKAICGLINIPVMAEAYIGDNETTTLNGRPIRINDKTHLEDAALYASDLVWLAEHHDQKELNQLLKRVKYARTWGNCFGYTQLAQGLGHVMLDPHLSLWDVAGLIPIVQGAGGVLMDYRGQLPIMDPAKKDGYHVVATVPGLKEPVLNFIRQSLISEK